MMKQKGGHGIQARITIDDIPQAQLDLLNSSTVTYEIRDAQTGVLESTVTRPIRSFTANFLRLMWGRMTGTACAGGLDINDTAIDESSGKATNLKCVGATTGLKKFGICIGTGTGAVAQTDNKLTWDTGFTTYGATTLKTATVISGSDIYFEIEKAFTNNTGSTRTIYEAGLCTTGEGTEADNNTNVLIAREITNGATGTAVATGKVLTVVFKISSTFTTDGIINFNFIKNIESGFSGYSFSKIWIQKDAGASWTARTLYSMMTVSYKGLCFIVGGTTTVPVNSVYSSKDLDAWTEVRSNGAGSGFTATDNPCVCVFKNKIFYIGGAVTTAWAAFSNAVYSSENGATWVEVRANGAEGGFPACVGSSAVVGVDPNDGKEKIYIIGGYNASGRRDFVYSSEDGATWVEVRANGAAGSFGARLHHCSYYFLGKFWVVAGNNSDGTNLKDSWWSLDCVSWTQATADTGFPRRRLAGFCVYGKAMVIVGGLADVDTPQRKDDIYYSYDGTTWTLGKNTLGYPAVHAAGCCVYGNLLVSAGGATAAGLVNFVWATDISSIFWDEISSTLPSFAKIDATSGSAYGITVGVGTTNFDGTDTALITPVLDGSGAGQLDYGDMTDAGRLSEPTVTGADNIMRLERDFANNSGGSITIKEVGLSAKGLDALGLLLMRGKVDKAVADGASVRVAIELLTTV